MGKVCISGIAGAAWVQVLQSSMLTMTHWKTNSLAAKAACWYNYTQFVHAQGGVTFNHRKPRAGTRNWYLGLDGLSLNGHTRIYGT